MTTGATPTSTSWSARPPITTGYSYILTESGEIITTESGLPIVYEYGTTGTLWTGRVIPT